VCGGACAYAVVRVRVRVRVRTDVAREQDEYEGHAQVVQTLKIVDFRSQDRPQVENVGEGLVSRKQRAFVRTYHHYYYYYDYYYYYWCFSHTL
jgi:hypothetical protein